MKKCVQWRDDQGGNFINEKRVVACILAVACIASLNGCGSKFNGQDTVVEVGDEKVTADVANFCKISAGAV